MTAEQINGILGIKEAYQLHDALEGILFDKQKRESIFEKFLSMESDTEHDWFTDYFQSTQSDRKQMMQDYTPDGICKLVSMLVPDRCETVFDCCSGTGGLTIPLIGRGTTFYCQELSENSLMLLLFNLSIRGAEGYVGNGNCLTNEFKTVYRLTKRGKFSDIERVPYMDDFKADVVVSNPPYSQAFQECEQFKDDERFREYGLPPKSKADYAFVLHALYHLKDGGTAVFILPHGVLFRGAGEAAIRKKLIEDNLLDAVIGLAGGQFMNTQIPVCLMVLKKNRDEKGTVFIDALKQFEKCGKVNRMTRQHLDKIVSAYRGRKDIEKFCRVVDFSEMQKNDFNLNIPRYVDTSEEAEPVNLYEVLKEIVEIEKQEQEIGRELAEMLQDLHGPDDYESQKAVLIDQLQKPDSTLSDMLQDVLDYLEREKENLKKTHVINLMDVCTFERSRKGKIYKAEDITIQVSATRGQMSFLKNGGTVEPKDGVFEVMDKDIYPKYLYYVMRLAMPHFLERFQTGLNINPEIFKMMRLTVHTDQNTQKAIADILDKFEMLNSAEEQATERLKDVKKYHLENMFC